MFLLLLDLPTESMTVTEDYDYAGLNAVKHVLRLIWVCFALLGVFTGLRKYQLQQAASPAPSPHVMVVGMPVSLDKQVGATEP